MTAARISEFAGLEKLGVTQAVPAVGCRAVCRGSYNDSGGSRG